MNNARPRLGRSLVGRESRSPSSSASQRVVSASRSSSAADLTAKPRSLIGAQRMAEAVDRPRPGGADDTSDDNAYDNPAPAAPSESWLRRRLGVRDECCVLLGVKGSQGVTVIIVSEPSAKVARRIRTGRSTPARSRSSAAHNDIPRYAGRTANQRSHRRGQPIKICRSGGSGWTAARIGAGAVG
jgi:hypothetical protein